VHKARRRLWKPIESDKLKERNDVSELILDMMNNMQKEVKQEDVPKRLFSILYAAEVM